MGAIQRREGIQTLEKMVVLASGSPRRSELLSRMGIPFVVDARLVDENERGDAAHVVCSLAQKKAQAVLPYHPERIILAADTVVVLDEILGKPRDAADARRMLAELSGRWHAVYTGVCTLYKSEIRCEAAMTRVHFVPLSTDEIDRYIDTGDPMDKAGAYGIQGMAGMFIDEIRGCPHNVMGLPLALTKKLLNY